MCGQKIQLIQLKWLKTKKIYISKWNDQNKNISVSVQQKEKTKNKKTTVVSLEKWFFIENKSILHIDMTQDNNVCRNALQ